MRNTNYELSSGAWMLLRAFIAAQLISAKIQSSVALRRDDVSTSTAEKLGHIGEVQAEHYSFETATYLQKCGYVPQRIGWRQAFFSHDISSDDSTRYVAYGLQMYHSGIKSAYVRDEPWRDITSLDPRFLMVAVAALRGLKCRWHPIIFVKQKASEAQ